MKSREGLAVALLLCAVSTHGQVEVRPVLSAPALPAALGLASPAAASPSPLAAAPVLTAAPLAAAAPAAAATVPPASPAAALPEALADFAAVEVDKAPPDRAAAAGETLMLRALGGSAGGSAPVPAAEPAVSATAPALERAASAPRPPQRRLYLLSKPLRETVTLGPLSILAHIGFAAAWELGKAWVGWKAGGWPGAVAVTVVELPASPLMVTARSLADLGLRYWMRELGVLRELARTPGLERIKVLTTGPVQFWGPLALRKNNMGLLFVESSADLPESVGRFGAPIPIADPSAQRVRLSLAQRDAVSPRVWTPTLAELLDGRPIPPDVAEAWRGAIAEAKRAKSPIGRISALSHEQALRIEAVLVGADGSETRLGSIVEGPSAHGLIGLGSLDRLRAYLGWARLQRALPVSDTVVARRAAPREPGLKALLLRAWRRLSGRLILAP